MKKEKEGEKKGKGRRMKKEEDEEEEREPNILEFKSTKMEVKNSLEGLNNRF